MVNENLSSWKDDLVEASDVFKLEDGATARITFLDEGEKQDHVDYGKSVKFTIKKSGEETNKVWFVYMRNIPLLSKIKGFGKLTGRTFVVSRKGSKRSDTRYNIEEAQ